MREEKRLALEIAKEIVSAKMGSSTSPSNSSNGKAVAEFYEAIYEKVIFLATKED